VSLHGSIRQAATIALTLAAFVGAAVLLAPAQERSSGPTRIEVRSSEIASFDPRDPERRRFGALEFRGGLALTSPHEAFGGFSALRVTADGQLLALSDKGNWLRARIVYRNGAPAGIADAEMAPALGADGRPLAARGWYDTESLATDDAGNVYVGIERVNRIVRFDLARRGLAARGHPIPVPSGIAKLPYNLGLECLAYAPKDSALGGTLIAISERGLDADGNIVGFLIGGNKPGDIAVRRSDDYDVSDCAITPDGALIILERRYSIARGVAIRMRRVLFDRVSPGSVLDGPVLIEADMGYQIDNMEGVSVHRSASGELVLTLISDDNFSPLQRTLLLQFTLVE
jgi:hypothetical protein